VIILKSETLILQKPEDVVGVRQKVRSFAIESGFSLVDQTKIVTAASEIARNTVIYGGGGLATAECLQNDRKKGVRLTFLDEGPGIPDIEMALKDGYTTGGGLGLGLSGAKRLSNEFEITSAPGKGTRIVFTRWK
jgi:serine/threonine-protein kinase RsbT